MKKPLSIGIMLYFLAVINSNAQQLLRISNTMGESEKVSISEVQKLTFYSEKMIVERATRENSEYMLVNLNKLTFSLDNSTPLTEPSMSKPFVCYPVPTQDDLWLSYNDKQNSNLLIQLINMQGQNVMNRKYQTTKGDNQIHIEISHLPKGVYLCSITSNFKTDTQKIIIK